HQPAKPGKRPMTNKPVKEIPRTSARSTGRMKTQRLANEPVKVAGVFGPRTLNQTKQPSASKQSKSANQLAAKRLPQTGDQANNDMALLGVIGMLSTIGLAALRRKRRD
ncbi:LPXTG cell wall anchor domain-containing protein, partial [Lentilactobacillus kisonensis]